MQIVRITLEGVTAVLTGPNWEPGVWLGGKCIVQEVSDTILVPPGEPFEIDIKEARRLLRYWGGTILTEPAPLVLVEAIKAHDEELARRSYGPSTPHPGEEPDSGPHLGVRHGSRSQLRPSGAIFEIHHGRVE
jgi:hypothetical protein